MAKESVIFLKKTIYTNVKHDHFLPSRLGTFNFVPWQEMFVLITKNQGANPPKQNIYIYIIYHLDLWP